MVCRTPTLSRRGPKQGSGPRQRLERVVGRHLCSRSSRSFSALRSDSTRRLVGSELFVRRARLANEREHELASVSMGHDPHGVMNRDACDPSPGHGGPQERYAFSRAAMSSLTIFSSASVTRFDRAGSVSRIISSRAAGTICQRRPKRSMSQPHACALPPPSRSAFQYRSQLCLIVAQHDDRHRVVVMGPGAEGLEALAEEREVHHLHGARRPARRIAQERVTRSTRESEKTEA